jgi:hypothetical protein
MTVLPCKINARTDERINAIVMLANEYDQLAAADAPVEMFRSLACKYAAHGLKYLPKPLAQRIAVKIEKQTYYRTNRLLMIESIFQTIQEKPRTMTDLCEHFHRSSYRIDLLLRRLCAEGRVMLKDKRYEAAK